MLQALKDDLDRYLNHQPIKASPASFATRTSRWFLRNPVLAVLSSILTALVMALAIGGPIIAYRQSKLQNRTKQSLENQNRLAEELRGSTAAINTNLIKIYTERGDAAINAGNQLAALPSYTAALRGSIDSGKPEWGHRFRVGSILQHAAVSNFNVGIARPTGFHCDQRRKGIRRLHDAGLVTCVFGTPLPKRRSSAALRRDALSLPTLSSLIKIQNFYTLAAINFAFWTLLHRARP